MDLKENLKKVTQVQGVILGGLVVGTVALILGIVGLAQRGSAGSSSYAKQQESLKKEYLDMAVRAGNKTKGYYAYETYGDLSVNTHFEVSYRNAKSVQNLDTGKFENFETTTSQVLNQQINVHNKNGIVEFKIVDVWTNSSVDYEYNSVSKKVEEKKVESTADYTTSYYEKEGKYYAVNDFYSKDPSGEDTIKEYYQFTDAKSYKQALEEIVLDEFNDVIEMGLANSLLEYYGNQLSYRKDKGIFHVEGKLGGVAFAENLNTYIEAYNLFDYQYKNEEYVGGHVEEQMYSSSVGIINEKMDSDVSYKSPSIPSVDITGYTSTLVERAFTDSHEVFGLGIYN